MYWTNEQADAAILWGFVATTGSGRHPEQMVPIKCTDKQAYPVWGLLQILTEVALTRIHV